MATMGGVQSQMKASGDMPEAHLFTHDAMHTTFSLRLCGVDRELARGMARECCELLDLLEGHLSRFVEGSDISRINQLRAGETLYLSEACHQCLLLGLHGHALTDGLFDITLGARIAHWKAGSDGPLPPMAGRLTVHPDVPAITCESPGRELDLGGIGKGFALDQLKQRLLEWESPGALLAAGGSSLLAFGPDAWPVDLTGDEGTMRVMLCNQSLSASGTGIQGSHILHPGGPDAMPSVPGKRVWVFAATAALAEIWSTALMLVAPDDLPDWLARHEEITRVFADHGGVTEVRRP